MSQSLRQRALTASLGFAVAAAMAAHARAETLADAVADAYQTNPNLQAQRASLRALDENYVQARAGWRPTLNFQAQAYWTEIHSPAAYTRFGQTLPIERSNSGLLQFSFSQPIWTGGRTAAAVTAANADVLQSREQLRQAEAQVMQQVVTAYADVLRDQEIVAAQQQYEKLLERQLTENQSRFDVGEVTRTDVAQSQSRLASAQSQLHSAEAQLALDRSSYATLVGHNPGDLAPLPSIDYLMPGNVDDAFTIAEQNSPQLRAQEYAEQASHARVDEARAERMPTLSFSAVAEKAGGPAFPPFNSNLFQREGQASFTLTVPLFNGGVTTSRIRQNIERNNADRITIEAQRRSVLQTITQSWNLMLAARANVAAEEEQVRAATVAYQGMHEEEQAGLRQSQDVLFAAQDLSTAEVNLANARHDSYVYASNVLAVAGRLEGRNLIPTEPQYDPAANFRRLRFSLGWVPWEEPIGVIDKFLTAPPETHIHNLPREPALGPGLQPQPDTPKVKPAS